MPGGLLSFSYLHIRSLRHSYQLPNEFVKIARLAVSNKSDSYITSSVMAWASERFDTPFGQALLFSDHLPLVQLALDHSVLSNLDALTSHATISFIIKSNSEVVFNGRFSDRYMSPHPYRHTGSHPSQSRLSSNNLTLPNQKTIDQVFETHLCPLLVSFKYQFRGHSGKG